MHDAKTTGGHRRLPAAVALAALGTPLIGASPALAHGHGGSPHSMGNGTGQASASAHDQAWPGGDAGDSGHGDAAAPPRAHHHGEAQAGNEGDVSVAAHAHAGSPEIEAHHGGRAHANGHVHGSHGGGGQAVAHGNANAHGSGRVETHSNDGGAVHAGRSAHHEISAGAQVATFAWTCADWRGPTRGARGRLARIRPRRVRRQLRVDNRPAVETTHRRPGTRPWTVRADGEGERPAGAFGA
jgi:hypothetical protein